MPFFRVAKCMALNFYMWSKSNFEKGYRRAGRYIEPKSNMLVGNNLCWGFGYFTAFDFRSIDRANPNAFRRGKYDTHEPYRSGKYNTRYTR